MDESVQEDPLARVLPDPPPDGLRAARETAVHPVRWLRILGLPELVNGINLCLVRSITFPIYLDHPGPLCVLTMAYTDHEGRLVKHRLTDPLLVDAIRDLMARETVWLRGSPDKPPDDT